MTVFFLFNNTYLGNNNNKKTKPQCNSQIMFMNNKSFTLQI